jgi:phosphoribosyl-AMP cyclohydrolase
MQNGNIFADGALDRIFYGELDPNKRTDGTIAHYRVRGFRHESEAATRNGCSIVGNTRSLPNAQGVYAAATTMFGIKRRKSQSVFFPVTWTQDDIERVIAEVFETMRATGRGRWFKGETSGGMKLLVELDTRWCVADAMPYLPLTTPKRRKPACGVCGESLIKVCPRGHGAPSKMPKRLRWFKRWLKWFWFSRMMRAN